MVRQTNTHKTPSTSTRAHTYTHPHKYTTNHLKFTAQTGSPHPNMSTTFIGRSIPDDDVCRQTPTSAAPFKRRGKQVVWINRGKREREGERERKKVRAIWASYVALLGHRKIRTDTEVACVCLYMCICMCFCVCLCMCGRELCQLLSCVHVHVQIVGERDPLILHAIEHVTVC